MSGQPTLTLGDESPIVQEVADRLYRVGHLPAQRLSTTVFDEEMSAAVRHFQQEHGLIVDGNVDEETYHRLEEARWRLGDRVLFHSSGKLLAGEDVTALQTKLAELGFDPGRVDGLFGANSERALREFQKSAGLTQDGICGVSVYKALNQLSRTIGGGDPYLLRAQLNTDHFSGVQTRTIVLDSNEVDPQDPCHDIITRVEGRLAALGSSVTIALGLAKKDNSARAAFINGLASDIYVNVSQTSFVSPRARGCATYFFEGSSGISSVRGRLLAQLIQDEIANETDLTDGGTQGKSWDLLRRTQMPAVQIEIAYRTNDDDQRLLSDFAVRDKISLAITNGLIRFFQPNIVS
jgi:N-acetylmuramoyl-L-alanine amidase